MQTSGTFPGLSDGTRKTIGNPFRPAARTPRPAAAPRAPKAPATSHRSGGHAKHAKRGK